jgi:hypothetical protein
MLVIMPVRRLHLGLIFITGSILSAADAPQPIPEPAQTHWPQFDLRGFASYGPANGFLQTPAGGNPGSSSHQRPTLDEIGIDDTWFYDVQAGIRWSHFGLHAGFQALSLDGNATLDSTLISQNVTFPAGTPVQSHAKLNWFEAGGGWSFQLARDKLELTPKVGFAVLDFHYKLSGGGLTADRSYPKGTFRIGLTTRYRINEWLSVDLDAAAAPPVSTLPQIATVASHLEIDLLPRQRRFHPRFILGIGAQRIEYEDSQPLPNHFRVDLAPFGTVGLGFSF